MESCDALVVGAGPAGSHAARLLAARGFRVVMLEEHAEVGSPVQCAGVVTEKVFELTGREAAVVNRLSGVKVHSPAGRVMEMDGGGTRAVVIDRRAFDAALAADAVRAGADLRLGERVTGMQESGTSLVLHTARGAYSAGMVIGADGAQSSVARWAGLPRCREYLSAFQAFSGGMALDASKVEVFLGVSVAPGFFGWLVPHSDSEGYIGLATAQGSRWRAGRTAMEHMGNLIGAAGPAVRRWAPLHYIAGTIPLGGPKRLAAGRVALIGDAAGQVKPFSGGGIYTGLAGASMCAEAAARALESGSRKPLDGYSRLWEEGTGKELRRQYALRRAFLQLGDGDIEELLEILDEPELLSLVVQFGDIDFPSNLAHLLLRKAPVLLKFAGPAIKALL